MIEGYIIEGKRFLREDPEPDFFSRLSYDMVIGEFDTEAEAVEAVEDESAIEKALFANSASCPILDYQGDRIILHIPGEPNFELQIIAESQFTA